MNNTDETGIEESGVAAGTACILCSSNRLIKVETVSSKVLKEFYTSHFDLDVSRYFPHEQFDTLLCAECGLRMHNPAIPGDGAYYDHMQEFEFYYETDKPEFKYAIDTLMRLNPASVLEIGCGEGHFLDKIQHAFPVKAAELSEKSIAKLKEKGIELDDGEQRYDFCASFQVLEHVPDAHEFVQLMVGKLNPGGHLLISVPNKGSKYFMERFGALDYPPHHMSQWTRQALESLARIFELEVVDYYEEPHRIEHYQALIKARRQTLPTGSGLRAFLTKLMSATLDPVLAPYLLDKVDYPGMTHAMLYKKKA